MPNGTEIHVLGLVAPHAGAWIETSAFMALSPEIRPSRPTRARG